MAVVHQWWAWYWATPSQHCLYSAIMCVCVYFLTISTSQDTLILTSFYELIAVPCFHGTRWQTIDISIMFVMVLLKRYVRLQVECHLIVENQLADTEFCPALLLSHASVLILLCSLFAFEFETQKKGTSLGGAGRAVIRERSCSVKSLLAHVFFSFFIQCLSHISSGFIHKWFI